MIILSAPSASFPRTPPLVESHSERNEECCEALDPAADGLLLSRGSFPYQLLAGCKMGAALEVRSLRQYNVNEAGADGMLQLSPGLVPIPDLSFIWRARRARHRRARVPILPLVPDLAVEVLSDQRCFAERWNEK